MYSFIICSLVLLAGFIIHGRVMERMMRPRADKATPAISMTDGVDYVPMPTWKVFMVQFLNIAGTGPIFGAVMGAMFGPACFIWITLGCLLIGAPHDYFVGMLSLRNKGINYPELIGKYMGRSVKHISMVFSLIMLILVGTVFVYSPALILAELTEGIGGLDDDSWAMIFTLIILAYYIVATLVPIDKIIGRIYPVFAFAILFMAVGLLFSLLIKWPAFPEIWDGLGNRYPEGGHIFPVLFITVACGAISGFHSTQSPLMARCLKNEKYGRHVFFGSMITEGFVALIWAAASSYFFYGGGQAFFGTDATAAPEVVETISKGWLGVVGGVLATLGIVCAPITSGDTALRSCRLIIADELKMSQKSPYKRLAIAVPIFTVVGLLLWFNISDNDGFQLIWRYFGCANQTLAVITLWTLTVYFFKFRKTMWYIFLLLPVAFLTSVILTFIMTEEIGFNLSDELIPYIGVISFFLSIVIFYLLSHKIERKDDEE